ncbi:MAG: hypothetical protein JSV04_07355 [Candidatus Heimdallarchaeota archaeon]|nr:MAG: hypothetical protein JSV04_07355 [Candidatus Heimdallarchaeota archaeon]
MDDVIRLYPSSLTLIQGDLPHSLLRPLITQLTISLLINNPRVELAFVDGANLFPYYEISQEARKYGLDPLAILDRIQLSRAFNYHQMTEILFKKLPQLLETNPIRVVLIPQISSLHLSKEALQYLEYDKLTATSSILELTQAVGRLKSLSLEYDLVGIMTAESAPHSNHKALGGTFLAHAATDIIRVTTTPGSNSTNYTLTLTVQKGGPEIQVKLSHEGERDRAQSIPLTQFW